MKTLSRALLVAALSGASAFGQSPEQSDAANVEELDAFVVSERFLFSDQVNALKSPTPIIDVPQSLSITGSDQIEERGFDSIGDIVDYTPGVNNTQGEAHRDAVVFRGSRSTGSFFVDGVRDDVQYYRPLYNVEQLEVLRGPNALLFGRGGTGGIINRVTKKGIIGNQFTEYQLSVDSFGAYGVQIDSNIILSEQSALRFNTYYDDLENHRDHYDGQRLGVNPTIHFEINDRTTVDISYEYSDNERFIDRGIPTGTDGEPIEAFEDQFFGDKDINEATFEAHVLRAALQHQFSEDLKGRIDLAYGDYDKYYANFYASDYDQAGAPDTVTLSGYVDTTQRKTLTLSSGLIGEFETGDIKHTIVSGLEFMHSDNKNDRFGVPSQAFTISTYNDRTGLGFPNPVDDTNADLNVFSAYIQNELALSEQFDLVLGGRYDRFDLDVTGSSNGSQVDEAFTPRLGVVFKPEEFVSLYASYSKTFLPQSGEQFASLGDAGLDPDEFINYEIGLKWDLTKAVSFTSAAFIVEQDTIDDVGGVPTRYESEISGFEAQLQGRLTDKWTMNAGYSYLDGEDDKSGNRPRELPENMLSIWNKYQLTEKFALGLGGIYQDDSFITTANDTTLPSYFRIDAAAYYDLSENFRIQLNVENLTDELYFPNSHGDHQVTVGAPINATVSIIGRF